MEINGIKRLVGLVQFRNYTFEVLKKNGVTYLRAKFVEADIITGQEELQHTRKWLLSEHMVKSEIIQTAFACVAASLEHTAREHFLYRGQRVYGPHFDVDALFEIAKARRLDYRGRV